jgi:predicted nucleic acid-binding protein
MPSLNSIVLDSHAVLAFFRRQAGEAIVGNLFQQSVNGELTLGMSVINWGEVWYILARTHSEKLADEKIALLEQIGLQKAEVDWATTQLAAQYKKRGQVSYADCFAAALAKQWNAPLVTGDREFKALETEIKILWL